MERIGLIEDALRVADKMLNRVMWLDKPMKTITTVDDNYNVIEKKTINKKEIDKKTLDLIIPILKKGARRWEKKLKAY